MAKSGVPHGRLPGGDGTDRGAVEVDANWDDPVAGASETKAVAAALDGVEGGLDEACTGHEGAPGGVVTTGEGTLTTVQAAANIAEMASNWERMNVFFMSTLGRPWEA